MLQDNITLLSDIPFGQALEKARGLILENGFLIIHEIDPQAILARHHIHTGKIRQLLFFHPVYMKQILLEEPAAVIEAPLKMVLREMDGGQTSISCFDPGAHWNGYEQLEALAIELRDKQERIMARLLD